MEEAIKKAFHQALEDKAKEISARLTKQFEKELNESISSIVVNVARQVTVMSRNDELVISLKDARS